MEQTYAGEGGLTDVNDASSVLAWLVYGRRRSRAVFSPRTAFHMNSVLKMTLRLRFENQCVRVRAPASDYQKSSFWDNQQMVNRLCGEQRKKLLPT
jgi:hypothetical protein